MKFIHRLGFYLGGFIIGIIILMFFLGGKKTSCDYGPEARTLKNIRLKKLEISDNPRFSLVANKLDTSAISYLLQNGDVLFSESETKRDSCNIYVIKGIISEKQIKIKVENCEVRARVLELTSI